MKETKNWEAYTKDSELLTKYIRHTTDIIGKTVEKCEILTCVGAIICLVICAIVKQQGLDDVYLGIGAFIMLVVMVIGRIIVKRSLDKCRKIIHRLMIIDQIEDVMEKYQAMEKLLQEIK